MSALELSAGEHAHAATEEDCAKKITPDTTTDQTNEIYTIGGIDYPLAYVKGYLRMRFFVSEIYDCIDIVPHGIVITIPDKGREKNSCKTGLHAGYNDSGAVEVQRMVRDTTDVSWRAKGEIINLRGPENIPSILTRMTHEVNWNVLETMNTGNVVIVN